MTAAGILRALPPGVLRNEAELAALLEAAYGEPGRYYHTLSHVARGVGELAEVSTVLRRPAECFVAFLFHDAVYDVSRKDNEERSAALFRERADTFCPDVDRDLVSRLVLLTARHGSLASDDLTEDERLFLDADTSVLGGGPGEYAAYAEGVRREYEPHVGKVTYALGRKAFLVKLLATERIFLSERFRARLEARGRANVRRELLGLG